LSRPAFRQSAARSGSQDAAARAAEPARSVLDRAGGETWEILPLPTQPNATVWGLATHPADANRIVAFFGEVYVTEDARASWRKISA
jgi:hypothetical protein